MTLCMVINRVRGRTLHEIAPEQYRCMPDKGQRNTILVFRSLVERSVEKQNNVYTCFIDYSKAFDTVKLESLVELLLSLDFEEAPTQLVTSLYRNQTVAVRCDIRHNNWMCIKQRVRQGYVASPNLIVPCTQK